MSKAKIGAYQSILMCYQGSAISEFSKWEDTFKYQSCQPEERRMSNLSDWAPSVNSTIDIQVLFLRSLMSFFLCCCDNASDSDGHQS